jgi:acyl-coenzyme A synthetase/AMP-(fatty) acid ligase
VQVAEGVEPNSDLAQQLIAYCREHLAGYKAPKTVDFIDEIPRTGTGKIQKKPIREPYWAGQERRI